MALKTDKSPLLQESWPPQRKDVTARKQDKAALAQRVLELLQEKPEGMCGGLLTQKLKQSDLDLITRAYSNGKEIQRGWLQDLMRKLPEVEHNPMGRDTWYKCSASYLAEHPDGPGFSPSRSISSTSLPGSPGVYERSPVSTPERITMDTPAKTNLANAVQGLLLEAPGGLSMSALGLRLRKSDPKIIDVFLEDVGATGPGESKGAMEELIRSIPCVKAQKKGGSEFYSIEKSFQSPAPKGAFSGLFDGRSPPSGRSGPGSKGKRRRGGILEGTPLQELLELAKAFFLRVCGRRACKP
jgi:hypothetical protein